MFDGAYAKKKSNCNIKVIRPTITKFINYSLKYNLLVPSYAHIWYQISINFSRKKSLIHFKNRYWSNLMIEYKLIPKLFISQSFFWSDDGRARVIAYGLQTKTIEKAVVIVRKNNCLHIANITFVTLILASTNHYCPRY